MSSVVPQERRDALLLAAANGAQSCEVCGCDTQKCICPTAWGEREKLIRSKMSRANLLQGMRKFLDDSQKLESYEGSALELCASLSDHGARLWEQETLLVAHRDTGALNPAGLENHNKAVNEWLSVCDEHIASMMLHDLNIQMLRKLSKQRAWPLPPTTAASSSSTKDHGVVDKLEES